MSEVDPTYPLYPIACILASTGVLLVLLTSFIRQNWNLGVAFLCFWLFVENLAGAANTIIWSGNADIKPYVLCDIVSHLGIVVFVVKPMATLIITRRLYIIASLQSVDLPSAKARRRNLIIEWTLGLVIPLLVAGPIYYINQAARFEILENFGCSNAPGESILELLLTRSWNIIPPLLSITVYCPRVVRIFYRQSKDVNHFLRSNGSVSRTNYFRILALATIDALLTLPTGIVTIVLVVTSALGQEGLPVYQGWAILHSRWEPVSFRYADLRSLGTSQLAAEYFNAWSSPVLALVTFGLFGLTPEARASYLRVICPVTAWFGWNPTLRARDTRPTLRTMEFGAPAEMSLDAELGSHPSFIDSDIARHNAVPTQDGLESMMRDTAGEREENTISHEHSGSRDIEEAVRAPDEE